MLGAAGGFFHDPAIMFLFDRAARRLVVGLSTIFFAGGVGAATESHPPIHVMSFNIRYGAANDGDNRWEMRKDLVAETILVSNPDLLGLQEALKFQTEFVRERLPDHGFHGVGRDDGAEKGEYVPIFYRKSRFDVLDSGHFWLSEDPATPGSVSWDSSLTRMTSWVLLADREANGRQLVFGNTHWDHRGAQARLESAKLIRERVRQAVDAGIPVILSGDFNTTEDRAPYAVLVRGEGGGAPYVDSHRAANPVKIDDECTFGAWTGVRTGNRRIDWIIHTPDILTLDARINRFNDAGRYPSDHYPVEAVLRLKDD